MIRMDYSNTLQRGDLDRTGDKNLIDDLDLETAVLISMFTEARTESGDEFADALHYRGGWWGDAADGVGDKIGSRLWLLRRAKATTSNINLSKVYIEECLQWLIDDGVAESITVETERGESPVAMKFSVGILRPGGKTRWDRVWEIQLNEL